MMDWRFYELFADWMMLGVMIIIIIFLKTVLKMDIIQGLILDFGKLILPHVMFLY